MVSYVSMTLFLPLTLCCFIPKSFTLSRNETPHTGVIKCPASPIDTGRRIFVYYGLPRYSPPD
jgi:hypothetical protein